MRLNRLIPIAALSVAMIGLMGCAPVVPMSAAKYASAVECAEVSVRLPDQIGDLTRVETNAQGTAAWGHPSAVLVRCGLEMPVASDELCVSVGPVDWLADGADDPTYVFISYGRQPAVEVIVNNTIVSGRTVLESLGDAVRILPQEHTCLTASDVDTWNESIGTPQE